MLLSEITILSTSGETLAHKKYRSDISLDTSLVFFERWQAAGGSSTLPPCFTQEGVHFYHVKRQSLFFVAVTRTDVSPVLVTELLSRVYHLCKDFCGTINEESILGNVVLIYELLDEMLDYGFVQQTSTDKLKPYIQSDPKTYKSPEQMAPGLFGIEHRAVPSDASNRPVIKSKWEQELRKNEIFVDVIERMTVLVDSSGDLAHCDIYGQLNMKSFLVGCPDIKVGFNEDLTVGADQHRKGYGHMVHLDECSFHDSVHLGDFAETKMVTIRPPEGEFSAMTYQLRGTGGHSLPFRVYSYLKNSESSRDLEVGLKLRCEIPGSCHAINVKVHLPVPKTTTGISQLLSGPGQMCELLTAQKKVIWTIDKIQGKDLVSAHLKLISANESASSRMELGPVALDFEISGFVCSALQIRFLRVFEREHSYVPLRWVRYITTSDSYIVKL